MNLLSHDCFYQMRQLHTVSRSLTTSDTSKSMHLSPLDLTIALLFTLASRLVYWGAWTGSCLSALFRPKFGRVSGYMCDVLHWLPSEQRIDICSGQGQPSRPLWFYPLCIWYSIALFI